MNFVHFCSKAFEIGKTYTLFCFIDNSQGTDIARCRMSIGKLVDGTDSWEYFQTRNIAAGEKGYSSVIITIPDNYNGKLNMQYQVLKDGTAIFSNIMLVEGSYNLNNLPTYEPYGVYKIPITVNDVTTNIYLDEPLRKLEDAVDYIDFLEGKVIRNVTFEDGELKKLEIPKEEEIELPEILLQEGTNIVTIGTSVAPSKMSVIYNQK